MQEAINIATPNLVNICIDSTDGIEKNGRMYCFYQEEPVYFRNSHELMKMMGALMDALNYPQSSVELRTYSERKQYSGNPKNIPILRIWRSARRYWDREDSWIPLRFMSSTDRVLPGRAWRIT